MKKTWNVEIGKKQIPMTVEMNALQNRVQLDARGTRLIDDTKTLRFFVGDVLPFEYMGHSFELLIHGPYVDLTMDGISQSYRQPVRTVDSFPLWTVPWFSLCLMLPVWTRAGLIPTLLGLSGMWSIAIVSRIGLWKASTRFFITMCIALAAWLLYFGLALLLSGMLFTKA